MALFAVRPKWFICLTVSVISFLGCKLITGRDIWPLFLLLPDGTYQITDPTQFGNFERYHGYGAAEVAPWLLTQINTLRPQVKLFASYFVTTI